MNAAPAGLPRSSEPAAGSSQAPIVQLEDVSVSFPGVLALDTVSMSVGDGEVLGLVGENGAGKSTTLDVMFGNHTPTSGRVLVRGEEVHNLSPRTAIERGIFRVFQEQGIIGQLPLYQNVYLGLEQHFSRGGVLRRSEMRRRAEQTLASVGLTFDVRRPARSYSFGLRQLVEVARIVAMAELLQIERPLLLLDEPTAALAGDELELFFQLLRRLREDFSAAIVFVSHRLDEVLTLSDRLIVMKDGRVTAEPTPPVTERELHRLMVGRERADDFYAVAHQTGPREAVVLSVRDMQVPGVQPVSLDVHAGEVVGVAGLLGSGKSELGAAVFGAAPGTGTVTKESEEVRHGVAGRIRAGIGYIPLDRHKDGILLNQSVRTNVSSLVLRRLSRAGFVRRPAREKALSDDMTKLLRVKMSSDRQVCRTLSGGNQQKVVFAKWLADEPTCLVVDNPTRGVDAGAKQEIYQILRDVTARGTGILLISDDLPELIGLADRVLVMRDGIITATFDAPADKKPREHDIVAHMV